MSVPPQLLIPEIQSGQAIINSRPQLQVYDQHFGNRFPQKPRDSQTTLYVRRTALIKRPKPCSKFRRVYSSFGDNCHFSRSQELPYSEDNHAIIIRRRLCWRFCNGEECPYGDKCHFLHEIPKKLKEDWDKSTKNCGTNLPKTVGQTSSIVDLMSPKDYSGSDELERLLKRNGSVNPNPFHQTCASWKTRLCIRWEATGHCSYGLTCNFAHGPAELRRLETHTLRNDKSLSKIGSGTKRQQVLGKKWLFKWKEVERISRIYADWVDEIPL